MGYFKYLLLFCLFLQNPFPGNSQSSISNNILTEKGGTNNQIYFLVKESFPEKKKGNLFFNKKWTKGTITDFQNNQFKIPLRYRIYKEEMQVQHGNKTKALQLQQIKKVEFDNHTFIPSDFILNGEKFMSFFKIIKDGNLQLLKQYEAEEKNGICSLEDSFYSKKGRDAAEKIIFKKKYILELMKDHKTDIQKFIKDKKINLKKSDDIIKLFAFYNSF